MMMVMMIIDAYNVIIFFFLFLFHLSFHYKLILCVYAKQFNQHQTRCVCLHIFFLLIRVCVCVVVHLIPKNFELQKESKNKIGFLKEKVKRSMDTKQTKIKCDRTKDKEKKNRTAYYSKCENSFFSITFYTTDTLKRTSKKKKRSQ